MRYDDASQTPTADNSGPIARPDVDALPPGSFGPASGNIITGAGTVTGAAGADTAAGPASITEVHGAGGATAIAGQTFQAAGQYGALSLDAQGNFNYVRNPGTPDGVKDVFSYTLADASGATSPSTLTIDIGQVATAAADGIINLPAGVNLSDIHVVGRDLVIDMPDGTHMVIPGGAVFVPQLVIGDVSVPPSNVAALLIDNEPQPAAGPAQSSGGNFADPVPPLDPGVPLGDLIPPTELTYVPPDFEDIGQFIDREVTVVIQTPDNPAGAVAAVDSVDEGALPARGSEPPGSHEASPDEGTTGTIVYSAPDGVSAITLNGVAVTAVGQQIAGQYGTLTITSIADGQIGYSYLLADNTSGDATHDDFSVTVTDSDGDSATATLVVSIVDDIPTARNDTDALAPGQASTDGNVMSGVGTTSGAPGADTVGADNAHLTGVSGAGGSDTSFDSSGNLVVNGQFGTLTIKADGSYTYARSGDSGGTDTFTYTLTDGDGDTSTATLTITVPVDLKPTLDVPDEGQAGTIVDEKGLPPHDSLPAGSGESSDGNPNNNSDTSETTSGTIHFTQGDAPATVKIDGVTVSGVVGQTFVGDHGTLTITGYNAANGTITYSYTLTESTAGNDTTDHFDIVVTDSDGDTASGTLTIDIVDDVPNARNDSDSADLVTHIATGNVITGASTDGGTSGSGVDTPGADGAQVTGVSSNNVPANVDNNPVGDFVVAGQYGTLTLHADGSYSYTANEGVPGGSVDVFTYTLTDGDGDSDTATLTITNPDHTPTILIETPDNPAGAVNATESVNEKGLPERSGEPAGSGEIADGNGTNDSDSSETNTGTIVFNSADGVASVTVQGSGGPVAITSVGQTIDGSFGTMTITSINLVTGEIGYSYTLNDNTSGNTTHDDFTVVVTDTDGDTATGTLKVNIIDDVPTAHNDTDSLAAGTYGPELGNVITGVGTTSGAAGADVVGADDAQVSALASNNVPANVDNNAAGGFVVQGQYGTLTLQADGSYSYARDAGTPGGVSDVFTYTLTDGDGDTTTATLTISIGDSTPDVPANTNVGLDDDALAGGNPGGTGDDPDSSNVSGSVAAVGGDGPITYALSATGAPAGFSYALQGNGDLWVMQGATHVLTVTLNQSGAYTVTQVNPIDHSAGGAENNQPFTVTFSATDQDSDVDTGTFTISVDDDTPLANNDSDSIASGNYGPAIGNVITGVGTNEGAANADKPGADGFDGVVGLASNNVPANVDNNASGGFVVAGQYGTLTLQADGSYSYARAAGTPGGVSDVFTYTYQDGDGDTVSATLTINIGDSTPDVPANTNVGLDDDALAGGNPGGTGDDPDSSNTSGSVASVGGDGPITYALSATGAPAGFSYALQGNGDLWVMQGATHVLTVTLNQSGAYTVTQVNPIDHSAGGAENNQPFTVTFSATDQDSDVDTGTFTISVDDDTPLANNDSDTIASGSFVAATGNVITGVGTNEGAANADKPGADGFDTITVVSSNNVPAHVDNDVTGGFVVVGQYGTLTMQADGSYSYARDAGSPGGVSDVFTYTYKDGDGDTVSATLTINIGDSVPDVPANTNVGLDDDALAGGNPGGTGDDPDASNVSGSVAAVGGDGTITYALSATGAPAGFSYALQGNGDLWVMQGATHVLTVTLNQSGAYTVTQVNPIDHSAGGAENNQPFTVTFSATDQDLDSDTGTFTISVDDDTPLANNDSDSIAGGNYGPAVGNVITGVGTNEGAANADKPGADGFDTISGLASNNVPANVDNNASGGFVVAGQYGTLTMQADGSYSYARAAGTPGGVSDVFTYTYKDGDGDTVTATLTIGIGDSLPDVPANTNVTLDDDALTGGNPGGTGDASPDTSGTAGSVAAVGGDTPITYALSTTGAPSGFSYALQGNGDLWVMQGAVHVITVTLNSSTGAYTVTQVAPIDHAAGLDENNTTFTINFSATDVDSDVDTGTLTINVDDDSPINFSPVDLTDTTLAVPHFNDALVNDGTANVTRALNDTNNDGVGENFIGADGFGSLVFTATGHTNGEAFKDAHGVALTSGGQAILATGYGTSTLTGYVESGLHAGFQAGEDSVVFTATLNPGTGNGANSTYTIDFDAPIDNGSGIVLSDFSTAPAGQNQWIGLDSDLNDIAVDNNDSPDLLLTGVNGGTVNTSSSDIGSNNQWIDQNEGIRIDFVTDVNRDGANDEKDTGGYIFDGHYVVNGTSFTIMQEQGSGSGAAVRIAAYNDPDTGNIHTLGGSIVAIDQSSIVVTGDATYTIVDMGDGTFVITGLAAGANVSFDTGGAAYNAISITNATGVLNPATASPSDTFSGQPFAIGEFGYFTAAAGHDVDLSLGVTATDHDGDTSTGTIDITLVPDSSSSFAATTFAATNSLSIQSTADTNHLVSTNDNHQLHELRALGGGNNAALIGAVAAAGLGALQLDAGHVSIGKSIDHSGFVSSHPGLAGSLVGSHSGGDAQTAHLIQPTAVTASIQGPQHSASAQDLVAHLHAGLGDAKSHAVFELSHGTEAAHQVHAPAAPLTAAAIAMPSAQQLAAVASAADAQHSVAGAQPALHNEVVGKVLADALHGGGGHGPNLDALINSLPASEVRANVLEALASHGDAAVSNGHIGVFAGFTGGHGSPIMEHMMIVHQDAIQAHS